MIGMVYEPKVSAFLDEAGQPELCRIGDNDWPQWQEKTAVRLDDA